MRFVKSIPLPLLALLAVILPMGFQALHHWSAFHHGALLGPADPDPWLRLTLVRDWLSGGSWYDHSVLRSDAPFGHTISPWTRPLDLVIAFFTELQPATIDLTTRLLHSALILPILWMALLLLGLYRAARIFTAHPATPFLISALIVSSGMMWNYFGTANTDHHSFLTVVFIWALGGILKPVPTTRDLLLSGLLFALQLWISPEAFVLIAAVYGWYGLRWLAGDKHAAKQLALLATTLAFACTASVTIERPFAQWLTPIYDSVSIVYVYMLTLAALAAWLLTHFTPPRITHRAALAAALAALLIGLLGYTYPLMLHGPLVNADPYIFSHFLPRINEARPLATQPLKLILSMLVQPLAALFFLVMAWRKSPAIFTRAQCLMLGYFLLLTCGLYISQIRFYYYLHPLVALILAPCLASLLTPETIPHLWPARWLAARPPLQQGLRRLPIVLVLLAAPTAIPLAWPSDSTAASRQIEACLTQGRRLIQNGTVAHLKRNSPLTLFLSTDLGGEALFWTPQRIVASNYHREGVGIRYLWEASDITDPQTLHRYLATRKVEALLLCPTVRPPEGSVLFSLQQGKTPPAWLQRVPYHLPPLPDMDEDADTAPPEGSKPALFLLRRP